MDWIIVLAGLTLGLISGLIIYSISFFFYKKHAFGFGDVKLLAVIGYSSGIQNFLYIFLGGTVLATLYAITGIAIGKFTWKTKIPLGTFLCLAAIAFFIIL